MFPKILEFLMWVIPLVVSVIQAMVSVIQAVRQPVVEDIIHHSVDALCGFVSRELGRLWRFASQKKPQKIEEELKTQIKENEMLREKNGAMEKQVAELQKIEEQLKIEKNYFIKVAAKNEVQLKKYIDDLVAKNEVPDKKMVDLQKIEKELKTKIKETGVENKVLKEKNEAQKKLVLSPVHGSFGGQIWSLTFEGKIGIIKSNIGEEGGIPLGPWGGNGGGCWAYKKADGPILQITIRLLHLDSGVVRYTRICSISFQSESRDGVVIGSSEHFGSPEQGVATTVRPSLL
ncbi:hypothetical protein RHGRI_033203 [Rhododendron griersonianum]|uniref:Uncharacterized protein n=1 Tax=Rhododendron griersonianum TaxID=479676 RepID=A0AAV6I1I8_9ERIC|nr:hypothetical protein RHGRI_033203 [Rhododendron griersonianum]